MEDVSISSLERRPCYCFFENEPGCFVAIRQRVSDAASYIFSLLSSLFQWTGSAGDAKRCPPFQKTNASPKKLSEREAISIDLDEEEVLINFSRSGSPRPDPSKQEEHKVIEFLCPLFEVSFHKLKNRDAAEKKLEEAQLFFQDHPLQGDIIDAAQNQIGRSYDIQLNRTQNRAPLNKYERRTVKYALDAFFGMQSNRKDRETAADAKKRKWIIERAREESKKDNGFEFDNASYRNRTLNWITIWAYSEEFYMFSVNMKDKKYQARRVDFSGKSIPAQGRQFIASSIKDFEKEFSPKSNLPQ